MYIKKNHFKDDNARANTAKASLFTGAQASKKLKKPLTKKLADIFESSVPNISISQNRKMLTDV